MKFLLDTHTFMWMDANPALLSESVKDIILDKQNIVLLSYVSVWEIQIKVQLGKLTLPIPLAQRFQGQQQKNAFELLPIKLSHIFALDQLPQHHRDPFDRLLIAQAMAEELPILSQEVVFVRYPVRVIW